MKLKKELIPRSVLLALAFVMIGLGIDYLIGNLSWLGSIIKLVVGLPIAFLAFYLVLAWRQKRQSAGGG